MRTTRVGREIGFTSIIRATEKPCTSESAIKRRWRYIRFLLHLHLVQQQSQRCASITVLSNENIASRRRESGRTHHSPLANAGVPQQLPQSHELPRQTHVFLRLSLLCAPLSRHKGRVYAEKLQLDQARQRLRAPEKGTIWPARQTRPWRRNVLWLAQYCYLYVKRGEGFC